jgi:DNA-binding YbaB/EbfC family protein
MIPNMQQMMKQVQQMKGDMAKIQKELAGRTVKATAGAVSVTMTGKLTVESITIGPELAAGDVKKLQDQVAAAVNKAIKEAEEMAAKEMKKVTGGMGLPPGLF